MANDGREVDKQDLIDIFGPEDGTVNMYYGRIGNGKTYSATADILDHLRQGRVVYANWHINFDGFDERKSFAYAFWRFITFRKRFYKFSKENLRYFDPDDVDVEFLSSLTDCHVYIDEGQWIFDSYEGTKFSKAKRRLILHTRHLNRSLNIISQRTQAIQVSARGQVNRFFKCEKKLKWPFLIFRRTEFQEMKDNDVDETSEPLSQKTYFANKRVLNAYNSKYLRGGIEKSQDVHFEAFDYTFLGRLRLLMSFARFPSLRKETLRSRKVKVQSLGDKSDTTTIKTNTSNAQGIVSPLQKGLGSIRRIDGGKEAIHNALPF